jgi:hypothetical protein
MEDVSVLIGQLRVARAQRSHLAFAANSGWLLCETRATDIVAVCPVTGTKQLAHAQMREALPWFEEFKFSFKNSARRFMSENRCLGRYF